MDGDRRAAGKAEQDQGHAGNHPYRYSPAGPWLHAIHVAKHTCCCLLVHACYKLSCVQALHVSTVSQGLLPKLHLPR